MTTPIDDFSGPFTFSVGSKTHACEQCGVNLFRKQADNNRITSPPDTYAVRCECSHCGEPVDIVFKPYRIAAQSGR